MKRVLMVLGMCALLATCSFGQQSSEDTSDGPQRLSPEKPTQPIETTDKDRTPPLLGDFTQSLVSGALSGSVIAAIIGLLFYRRTKSIEAEIKGQLSKGLTVFQSRRKWEEQVVADLLGPICMQLRRTQRAVKRWDKKNLYLEGSVVLEGNMVIRDLLLTKGHLIPDVLLGCADDLITHYDRWLEEYDMVKTKRESGEHVDFVFTYDFPKGVDEEFSEVFRAMRGRLYKPSQ